ncbi:hypothetical protein MPL3365_170144 [Mesorhizobium plurifarium]|uniref:Uncharacterized protein n=1 Tax=Mesorhizobium plurifarium TaxID=69974 RepID=A0A090FZ80_MESPL|nr:hypothetical protein MPL3365_170144 [Mesorhizobium plurifarium]
MAASFGTESATDSKEIRTASEVFSLILETLAAPEN